MSISDSLLPDRTAFGKDPFGYASTGWLSWGLAQNLFGGSIDLEKYPTREALKSPVLWLTHAHALSEAAVIVLRANPNLDHLPLYLKGICDAQYCGVGLMLVGYSLEICLKGMLILKNGVTAYTAEESKFKHHKLNKLAEFIPDINTKDQAILTLLTHFLLWAGRYPDPGLNREDDVKLICELSEEHQIAANDLFTLASRIMKHAQKLV